jgi:penicillin-binding protein 1A
VIFVAAKQQKGSGKTLRVVLGALALTLLLVGGTILVGCTAVASAPDITRLEWDSSTVIYDRDAEELYRLFDGKNRTPVALADIPEHVVQAFIAIEDPSFYQHRGVNPRAVARAVWRSSLHVLGLPGGRLEGGSTITQQLARDGWLTQKVSIERKIQEAYVALQLERSYTKAEILEMYLNQIYFGGGAYGIEAAAGTFFAKDVGELSIAEGAQLAGMINGPSYFDPYVHPEDSLQRRNLVLQAMLQQEKISADLYAAAKAEEPILGSKQRATSDVGGHFTDYVINILHDAKPGLAERYGLSLGDVESVAKAGLKVYTTLDPRLQALAEAAVTGQMDQADREYGLADKGLRPQAAMVTMNPKTGEVLAMVGGRDHEAMLQFNMATDALRQPGSAIKPLVAYGPALEAGLTAATIFDDAPVMLSNDGSTVWPQNYDFKYHGLRPMRYGIEQSPNPPAVRAMQAAGGSAKGAEFARRLGLGTIAKEDEHLALALGGIKQGVTVLDMTAAYSAIANMGLKIDPIVITRIEDSSGRVIFEAHPQKEQVLRPANAYILVDMMKDVIRKGTAYGYTGGFKGWPAAGKTGTTEENRDAWFVGFTPDLVTTVWNGYQQEQTLPWTGAFVPVKIWNQFMTQAVTERPTDWVRPADVVTVTVCRQTGMLPGTVCPKDQVGPELFVKGTEPRTVSNQLVKAKAVEVQLETPDKQSTYTEWQLWQTGCLGQPVERNFIKRAQPRVQHPTDPWNPKYVPIDAKDELPTRSCEPVSWWERLIPRLPTVPVPKEPTPPARSKP